MHGRQLDGTTYTFGHEGILYRDSFIMYDKQTDTKWVHTTGEAVEGPLIGKVLTSLPSTVMSWKRWKTLHPQTLVLTGKKAAGFMGQLNIHKHPERYGISVGQGNAPKLYPLSLLREAHVINDTHGGRAIVVFFDAESQTARAFDRGALSFRWDEGTLRDGAGHAWDALRGARVDGGGTLAPAPATQWLLERWHGFHPRGAVFTAAR